MRPRLATIGALGALMLSAAVATAQTDGHSSGPSYVPATLRVFLDCSTSVTCDNDYVRTAVGFVAYVRDPAVADVHVLLTAEPTGTGGLLTTGRFIGRGALAGLVDTLNVATVRGATDDEQRKAIASLLSAGLVRFAARRGLVNDLSVAFAPRSLNAPSPSAAPADPWNAWVFSLGATAQVSGQQYARSTQLVGALTADRVTEAWRIDVAYSYSYSDSHVNVDSVNETTVLRSQLATGQIAKSVTSHWSAGLVGSISSSTFINERLAAHVAPAIEFDVFPYSEATHHQLTVLYAIGGTIFDYYARTIFDRTSEMRPDQSLTVALGVTEPWGSATAVVQGAAFVDDIRKNRQVLSADVRVRLFSGLSLTIDPQVLSIHDQIYLAAGTASRDDILLARRQLATSYQYALSAGLTFTFGSIFNGIVNPRFNRANNAGTSYSPY